MERHPLAVLRASIDRKQAAYARLVAKVHADLNLGHIGERPEKISLWESGRVVPDLGSQLAIAHIHDVPRDQVLELGWPRWLHLAGGDARLLMRPWTAREALEALDAVGRAHADGSGLQTSLAVTGRGVALLTEAWHDAITIASPTVPPRAGHSVDPCTVAAVAARVDNLEKLATVVDPNALHPAARGELRLIAGLLRTAGYDAETGCRLHLLAARTAAMCGNLMEGFGNGRRAEYYLLAAVRAATTAGAPQYAAAYMTQLAGLHLASGVPRDTLALTEAAARTAAGTARPPSPRLAALLHARRARAHARLGDARASSRSLDQAFATLPSHPGHDDPPDWPFVGTVDEGWLTMTAGVTWLHLGKPRRALDHFAPLIPNSAGAPVPTRLFPHAPCRFLHVIDAQLATGELEAAVCTARSALDLTGGMPPAFAPKYWQRFATYHSVPAVRDLRDRLLVHDASTRRQQPAAQSSGRRTPDRNADRKETPWTEDSYQPVPVGQQPRTLLPTSGWNCRDW